MTDHYEILGVPPTASAAEIRSAYARLARDKHPDRFTDPAQKKAAEREFQDITTAFNALVNPKSRQEYDEQRHRPAPRSAPEIARDAYERALPLVESGGVEEAVTLLRTAVHHAPEEAAYHVALGRALSRVPSLAREAVQVLERGAQLDPRSAAALTELAAVLARQGLRLRAQKAVEAALRLAPRDARVQRLAAELGVAKQ
jgi:curved DNA-binding protein CbpA